MDCKFEATDPETDAVVLMRLLAALRACFSIPAGVLFMPLPLHCLSTAFTFTFHCLSTAFTLAFHCLSTACTLALHCLSLTFHRLPTAF